MAERDNLYPFDSPPPDVPGETYQPRPPSPHREDSFDAGLSLTRLVVGAVLWGMDIFMDQLLTWDTVRRKTRTQGQTGLGQGGVGMQRSAEVDEPIVPRLHFRYSDRFTRQRDTLVGLVFVSRSALLGGLQRLGALQRGIGRRINRAAAPLLRKRLSSPIQPGFNGLVQRGEQEVSRLEQLGRQEAEISRRLAQTAVVESVEESIQYLAEHPEVKELVQLQSTGLADEAVEEIRERAVSADNFIEGLVRYLFRRLPRQEIPPPPSEVRERAERLHPERYQKQKRQP